MTDFGFHLAIRAAEEAFREFKAGKMAKRSELEAKRRAAEKLAPLFAEARLSGLQAAIIALGFHDHVEARNLIQKQIEAERAG